MWSDIFLENDLEVDYAQHCISKKRRILSPRFMQYVAPKKK